MAISRWPSRGHSRPRRLDQPAAQLRAGLQRLERIIIGQRDALARDGGRLRRGDPLGRPRCSLARARGRRLGRVGLSGICLWSVSLACGWSDRCVLAGSAVRAARRGDRAGRRRLALRGGSGGGAVSDPVRSRSRWVAERSCSISRPTSVSSRIEPSSPSALTSRSSRRRPRARPSSPRWCTPGPSGTSVRRSA
jgi:hypothetical protein